MPLNQDQQRKIETEQFKRSFIIKKSAVDEEARTVELAFSSEEPYERWFGVEILDHSPQSVRLDRLNGGAALLVGHDTTDQVGVVDSARVDADRRGRAKTRFSRSNRGQEILQDVVDGIRTLVSVGYMIHKYTVEERTGLPDLIRVTDWEPYEISIVPIPADVTVGVGRELEAPPGFVPEQFITEETAQRLLEVLKSIPETETKEVRAMPDPVKPEVPEFDEAAVRTKIRTEEKKRADAIRAMADKFDLPDLARKAIDDDWDIAKFNAEALNEVGKRNNNARGNMREDVDIDLSDKEHKSFSMMRLMEAISQPNDRSAQTRAGFELEVCAEAEKKMPGDFKARGVYVPASIMDRSRGSSPASAKELVSKYLRDLSAGSATDGAELVATQLLPGEYISVLRNKMVSLSAGVRMLPGLVGNVDIPRQTSGATATWISSEGGDASESEPQFDQVVLRPRDLAVYTEVTRRLTQQSTPSIEMLVREDLYTAQALALDLAVYYGLGASGQPQGINGDTGVNDPTISSALAPTYTEFVNLIAAVLVAKALTGRAQFIISPATWAHVMTTPKQASGVEGNFIMNDNRIVGYDAPVSQQLVANDFVFGDFSQILLGEWGGLEINVDPFTKALSGGKRFIMFKTCDLANRHPECFSFHDAA